MNQAAHDGGGGGGGSMTVTIDHAVLDSAISKMSTLSTAVESYSSTVLYKSPVDHPTLTSLSSVPTWLDEQRPMLTGLRDIAHLLATHDTPVATFTVGTSPEDISEMLGRTLAERALETNPYDPDSADPFLDIMSRWADDPAVMAQMQRTLGAEDSLRLLSNWAVPVNGPMEPPTEQQQEMLRLMRLSLQTATQPGGFSDYEAEQFAEDLVEQATIPGEDLYGRGTYNPSGALAYLLQDGRFSDTFIGTVTDRLDQYERQDNNGAGGDLWNSRPTQGTDFGAFMDYGTFNPYEGGNLDPITSAFSALGNSPQASLEFFGNNDDDGVEGGELSRAYYYIHERTYPHDAYGGLTSALDAASTDPSIVANGTDEQKRAAALLASKTVEYFSEIDGDAEEDLKRELMRFPENGASESLAHILSTYMPGVERGIGNSDDIDPDVSDSVKFDAFNGNFSNVPIFDSAGLKDFMQLATATDEGLAELTHGMNVWRGENLGALADEIASGQDDNGALRTGIQNDARLQGFLIKAMADDDIEHARGEDERINATIDMFSDVVDLVPVPGASRIAEGIGKEVLTYTLDEAKGSGFDALKEHYANNEEGQVGEYNNRAEALLQRQQYTVAELLASHGLLANEDQLSEQSFNGGHVPTYREYMEMSDGDRETVQSELFSSDIGVGQYMSEQDYREAFSQIIDDAYFTQGE